MNFSDFLPLISGAVGGAASVGVFKGPIKTLDDWWYVTFGHKASEKADMLRVKKEADLENYKQLILKELTPIKEENIQSPQLSILGPALEASSYYIEEEDLRKMFAKLIASTFDKTKNKTTHVSFVEVIKQLSAYDAKLLKEIKIAETYPSFPIVSLLGDVNDMEQSFKIIKNLVFVIGPYDDLDLNEFSISNLIRLGILTSNLEEAFPATLQSSTYDTYDIYNQYSKSEKTTQLKKGCLKVTAFGQNLLEICI